MNLSVNQRSKKVMLTVALLVLAALVIGLGTWAAFSSTTTNPGNNFASGTVVISDNDGGSAMFNLSNLKPNDSADRCIQVTYTGTLPSSVRLYGTVAGSGLDDYLDVTVTRGVIPSGAFPDCSSFTPDSTDYNGDGPGVIFSDVLGNYPATYAAGIVDPSASWGNGDVHAYQFEVTQEDNNSAQGLTATSDFTWEARNN